MSHPDPTKNYGDELPSRFRPKKLNPTQKNMKQLLGEASKGNQESDLAYLKRVLRGNALTKKMGGKKKSTPKYGRYGNERPHMKGQSSHLPPGYKQSDLE